MKELLLNLFMMFVLLYSFFYSYYFQRQNLLTKLIQAIRLSAFFNKRYDLFTKALKSNNGASTFNVASLIKLSIWSEEMSQALTSAENKMVKTTRVAGHKK